MKPTLALFGGSFNPPGIHHRKIVERIAEAFDEVVIFPCGPRPDKSSVDQVTPEMRSQLCSVGFAGLKKSRLDLSDVLQKEFTRTWELQERFSKNAQLAHVVGADLLSGGAEEASPIQTSWTRGKELWNNLSFLVLTRPGSTLDPTDLPPHHILLNLQIQGSSSEIRRCIKEGESIENLVLPEVRQVIELHGLYR